MNETTAFYEVDCVDFARYESDTIIHTHRENGIVVFMRRMCWIDPQALAPFFRQLTTEDYIHDDAQCTYTRDDKGVNDTYLFTNRNAYTYTKRTEG